LAIKAVVHVPTETITDDTVLIGSLFVATGSLVKKGDPICEIETSKSVMEIESPSSGYIELKCVEAQEIRTGDILAIIYDTTILDSGMQEEKESSQTAAGHEMHKTVFSDDAIALIKQYGLSIDIFNDRAFVRKKDIIDHLEADTDKQRPPQSTPTMKEKIPTNADIVPIRSQKTAEIKNVQNGQNASTSTVVSKIRLPDAVLKNKTRSVFRNLRNSLTALIILHIDRLLKQHRELNAFYHDNAIHYYKEVNIGYAIDLDRGLRVVSLGDVKEKTTEEINEKLIDLIKSYLQDEISIKDMQGSTFTVTDLSSEDVYCFSPLINKFQSAILGISSIDEYDGSCLLSLVFDHRVTEGKKAARFLKELKKMLTADLGKLSRAAT
jgi:pyruvate/2-oxoglutarate dehydrogenase complex dihydrolipoamide acyltransferase (E2) component